MNDKCRRSIIVVAVALFIAAVAVGPLRAQTYANVTGFVTDQSGAAIPEVALKLQNSATGEVRTTSSDNVGQYVFTLIPPGTYTLTAAKSGFATESRSTTSARRQRCGSSRRGTRSNTSRAAWRTRASPGTASSAR